MNFTDDGLRVLEIGGTIIERKLAEALLAQRNLTRAEEQMKFAARDATIAVQKKLDIARLGSREARECLDAAYSCLMDAACKTADKDALEMHLSNAMAALDRHETDGPLT